MMDREMSENGFFFRALGERCFCRERWASRKMWNLVWSCHVTCWLFHVPSATGIRGPCGATCIWRSRMPPPLGPVLAEESREVKWALTLRPEVRDLPDFSLMLPWAPSGRTVSWEENEARLRRVGAWKSEKKDEKNWDSGERLSIFGLGYPPIQFCVHRCSVRLDCWSEREPVTEEDFELMTPLLHFLNAGTTDVQPSCSVYSLLTFLFWDSLIW